MKESNWARILVCGLVAGGVWIVVSVSLLAFIGDDFFAEVREGRRTQGLRSPLFLFAMNLGAGIWAMWLYVVLRPHYGVYRKSALAASLAWWLMSSMQSAKWVVLLEITPSTVIMPLIATLPGIVISTLVGAWFYER